MLEKLVDAKVRRDVCRIRSKDVEQLLVNRMLTRWIVLGELIFTRVRVEETRSGRVLRSNIVTKVSVIFIDIVR